jgi:hypothetical protein
MARRAGAVWSMLRVSARPATVVLATAIGTFTACGPPAAPPRLPVLAIGDSVMALAWPALKARGIAVDAQQSRQFKDAIPLVKLLAAAGRLPATVVVHLGTNGPTTAATCDALAAAVGRRRLIFLNLNLHARRTWEQSNNAVIAACALRHRDRLIDWKAASTDKPWFAPDLIHLSPTGTGAYAALIRAGL